VGEGSAYMAKPPPYGQKRDGHPHLRAGRTFGHPKPTGAYMAKEGVGEPFGPYGHPLRGGPPRPLMAKRVIAIPMGKEHLAIPSLRPMGEGGSLWP